MRKLHFVLVVTVLLVSTVWSQKKPWEEWSKAEAEKILNHSPWGQTQTETDTSEMTYSPTTGGGSGSIGRPEASRARTGDQQSRSSNRVDRGATNQAISVDYRIRLLSARPVRQAFMRVISLAQKHEDPELLAGLDAFVKRDFSNFIVVAVAVDATDLRFSGPVNQELAAIRTGTLKNRAYLERKDGQRIFLMEYQAPISDGLGAKFIFSRRFNEREFLNAESGTLRFYCELSQLKLNVTFKVADMMYEGKLEY